MAETRILVDDTASLLVHDKCADGMGLPLELRIERVMEGDERNCLCVCNYPFLDGKWPWQT